MPSILTRAPCVGKLPARPLSTTTRSTPPPAPAARFDSHEDRQVPTLRRRRQQSFEQRSPTLEYSRANRKQTTVYDLRGSAPACFFSIRSHALPGNTPAGPGCPPYDREVAADAKSRH